mmetsp:Transcript_59254/g.166824  ORF Transcript_59254/g.166824 Transcript_59254/m.166824 type:complete len:304 (-) Transcript_59254:91-1002(-)
MTAHTLLGVLVPDGLRQGRGCQEQHQLDHEHPDRRPEVGPVDPHVIALRLQVDLDDVLHVEEPDRGGEGHEPVEERQHREEAQDAAAGDVLADAAEDDPEVPDRLGDERGTEYPALGLEEAVVRSLERALHGPACQGVSGVGETPEVAFREGVEQQGEGPDVEREPQERAQHAEAVTDVAPLCLGLWPECWRQKDAQGTGDGHDDGQEPEQGVEGAAVLGPLEKEPRLQVAEALDEKVPPHEVDVRHCEGHRELAERSLPTPWRSRLLRLDELHGLRDMARRLRRGDRPGGGLRVQQLLRLVV